MDKKQAGKIIDRDWKRSTIEWRNLRKEIPGFVKEHPQSAVPKLLNYIGSKKALAEVPKIESFDFIFEPDPPRTGETLGECQVCGHENLIEASRIRTTINGKLVDRGQVGDAIGKTCKKNITYIIEGIKNRNFKMYEQDPPSRKKAPEKLDKITLALHQLPKKISNKLAADGFDLGSEIGAEAVKELQRYVREGDESGIERLLDKGKARDEIGWAIANKDSIYDREIYHITTILEVAPEMAKIPQWVKFLLFTWQERPRKPAIEIGGIREEIKYLSELSKDHPVIKEYGSINITKNVAPVKAFDRAQWKEVSIEDLINPKRGGITKAQSRALIRAVPYFRERREHHNRTVIESYCDRGEFLRLVENLRIKYEGKDGFGGEKRKYHLAKKGKDGQSIEEPDMAWKRDTYLAIKNFIEDSKEKCRKNKITIWEYALTHTYTHRAPEVFRTLFAEGRKLNLAQKLGEHTLKEEYLPVSQAGVDAQQLDKLLNGTIEFEHREKDEKGQEKVYKMPRRTLERIQEARTTQKALQKIITDVRESAAHGIVPTKYVQSGENGSALQRAVQITANYEKDNGSIAEKINYLRLLEKELNVRIVNVSAEDGRSFSWRKSDAKFNTKAYEGKTYFSQAQKTAIENLFGMLNTDLKEVKIPQAKKAMEEVEKFYEKYPVYADIWFNKERLGERGAYIRYKPFNECTTLAEEIQKFNEGKESKYVRLNQRLKERIAGLKGYVPIPKNIDAVLAGDNVLLTKKLVDEMDARYKAIAERTIAEGKEKYQNKNMQYFDVVVMRQNPDDKEENHCIRAAFGPKRNGKALLMFVEPKDGIRKYRNFVVEPHPTVGTWYGRGRTRDQIEKLCARAEAEGQAFRKPVYLKILNARR